MDCGAEWTSSSTVGAALLPVQPRSGEGPSSYGPDVPGWRGREVISPLVDAETAAWLEHATHPVGSDARA